MKSVLVILGILILIGLLSAVWAIYKFKDTNEEDLLLANDPTYLGQGHWINK